MYTVLVKEQYHGLYGMGDLLNGTATGEVTIRVEIDDEALAQKIQRALNRARYRSHRPIEQVVVGPDVIRQHLVSGVPDIEWEAAQFSLPPVNGVPVQCLGWATGITPVPAIRK